MNPRVAVSYDPGHYSAAIEGGGTDFQCHTFEALIDELLAKGILLPTPVERTPYGNRTFTLGAVLGASLRSPEAELSEMLTWALRIRLSTGLVHVLVATGELDSSTLGGLLYSYGNSIVVFKLVPDLAIARAELDADGPETYDLVIAYAEDNMAAFTHTLVGWGYGGPMIITSDNTEALAELSETPGVTVACHPAALTARAGEIIRPLAQARGTFPF